MAGVLFRCGLCPPLYVGVQDFHPVNILNHLALWVPPKHPIFLTIIQNPTAAMVV